MLFFIEGCFSDQSTKKGGGALDRFAGTHDNRSSNVGPKSSSHPPTHREAEPVQNPPSIYSPDPTWSQNPPPNSDPSLLREKSTNNSENFSLDASFFCIVPPFLFFCMPPSFYVERYPYSHRTLYIRSQNQANSESSFTVAEEARGRHVEFGITAFPDVKEKVFSHELQLHMWIRSAMIHGSWEHFYEALPDGTLDHLDILRLHFGMNLFGSYIDRFEFYPKMGILSMFNDEIWYAALDLGAEMRAYPLKPFVMQSNFSVSMFEVGPPLLDARFDLGIALKLFEFRAGIKSMYQGEAQGFIGPTATALVRF